MCSVNDAEQTGTLPLKVRVVGSIPLPETGSFFLLFFSSTSFLAFLTPRVYPGVCASVGRALRVYLVGLLTTDFDHKHSSGYILGLWLVVQLTFDFEVQLLRSISKERQGYGDHSGPRILEIDPVVLLNLLSELARSAVYIQNCLLIYYV